MNNILNDYVLMRRQGIPAAQVLKELKPQLETLQPQDEQLLLSRVRVFEQYIKQYRESVAVGKVGLQPIPSPQPEMKTINIDSQGQNSDEHDDGMIVCPNCSALNFDTDDTCRRCKVPFPDYIKNRTTTNMLRSANIFPDDTFNHEKILVLFLPQVKRMFEVRPQDYQRELIVGRYDNVSGLQPDVDLHSAGALELGVSRNHMAIIFNSRQNRLLIRDLGSKNGIFQNGLRLPPYDVSILHNGDLLELGQMQIRTSFVYF